MARIKVGSESVRKLTKMGGGRSFGVTLPIGLIRKLGWKERQKLVVKPKGKKIVVKDWKV